MSKRTQFKNYSEYVSYNDQNPSFRRKSPKLKRADWQAYLLRRKRQALEIQVKSDQRNRSLVPVPPPMPRGRNRAQRTVFGKRNNTPNVLSDCLLLFAQASIDPFTKLTQNPCIPDAMCAPSFKFTAKIECDLQVGLSGVGIAALCPWVAFVNDLTVVGNDINLPLIVTNKEYPYTDIQLTGNALSLGYITAFNSNSPFTEASGQSNVPMRLVSAGLEIMYSGQLMDQAGTVSCLQWDGLGGVPVNTLISSVRQNPRTATCANSKDNRCYVSYYPTSQEFLSYKPSGDYFTTTIADLTLGNNHPLLIVVSGATPDTSFMVRAICHFECLMPNLNATPSESDPIGYPAFNSARSQLLSSPSPEVDLKNTLVETVRSIGKTVSGMGGTLGGAIGTAFGNPVAGAAIGSAAGNLLSSILGD